MAGLTSTRLVRAPVGGPCGALLALATASTLAVTLALAAAPPTSADIDNSTTTITSVASTAASPADTWLTEAIGAEINVGSVHVDGSIQQGKSRITLHLLVNGDGEGGGTFQQGGYPIRLKRVATLLYFNAPKKFWSTYAPAAQAKRYGGKWIEVSALDSRFVSFVQFLYAAELAQAVFQGHHNPLTLAPSSTIGGRKMIVIKDVETANGEKSTGLMYVSATGTPYVYRIVAHTPGEVSTLNFSAYGKPVSITVPAEAINLT